MNKNFMIFAASFLATFYTSIFLNYAHGKEAPKPAPKTELSCITNAELDKIMTEKNYDILFNMTNEDGIVESIWYAGQSIIITGAVPGQAKSCLLATMNKVTYNPKAIEDVWETYKKQTKQKDI